MGENYGGYIKKNWGFQKYWEYFKFKNMGKILGNMGNAIKNCLFYFVNNKTDRNNKRQIDSTMILSQMASEYCRHGFYAIKHVDNNEMFHTS